jgi:hypothetical protein
MGVKILNEDGSVLFEFRNGLGLPLLYRVLAVAKFTGEDQSEIILNPHVAALHRAIANAMPPARAAATIHGYDRDSLVRSVRTRIGDVFRSAVLGGNLKWLSWSDAEKRLFVREELFAPYDISDEYIADFIEEEDHYFADIRATLNGQ